VTVRRPRRRARRRRANAPQAPVARLGVYFDAVYRREGGRLHTNSDAFPFLRFLGELASSFERLTVFGRTTRSVEAAPYALAAEHDLVALPYYPSLRALGSFVRAVGGTLPAMWRGLDRVDAVLVFGPHPLGLAMALMALARRKRVVLGSREDTMFYFRNRLPSRLWAPVLLPLAAVDRAFRLLARRCPAVVVGSALERRYGGPRPGLLAIEVSLVADAQVAARPRPEPWGSGGVEMIAVGRVETEKNPLLLAELMALLHALRPGRYRLTVVGTGRLLAELERRCAQLGVTDFVSFAGFVPFGEELLGRYRAADVLVHTALTEGFPQVLIEAMACATPIVATDVGGVRDALDGGRAGALVGPSDALALRDAVLALDDAAVRGARVEHGLQLVRRLTMEATAGRLAAFIRVPTAPA
jgi:glycosyltransferase involved in cell wall biosynthesis